ncbi:MAG: dTDP-4-dehydrorhamnose 3,5-epimerase family protein, partial [Gammaproteobacteria bacterium]
RGFFARVFCRDEFKQHGLVDEFPQHNVGFNLRKGTLRGMHFQREPHAETKVVRCTRGALFDVALDLRPDSATFKRWVAVDLSAEDHRMLYIPTGCAHGYQTQADNTEVYYMTSQLYAAQSAAGVRHDDPAFAIKWPLPVACISAADVAWPDFTPESDTR